jgi:predicted nuclease of predicted toxin-antitoxin system
VQLSPRFDSKDTTSRGLPRMLPVAPGSPDPEVLARAQQENRVVVTFDKDFGELAFRRGLAASVGVVLFRITLTSPDHAVRVAVAAFASRADWTRQFAVVEDDRIRLRTLP